MTAENIPTLLGLLGTILGIMGAAGIAYSVFRTTAVSNTVKILKEENEVQAKALDRQAREMIEMRNKVRDLEEANRVLATTVSGTAAVERLSHEMTEEHNLIMTLIRRYLSVRNPDSS